MSSPTLRIAQSNRILATLPRAGLERVIPDLEVIPLPLRMVLQSRGRKAEHVFFPLTGVASMVTTGNSGTSLEVATIGCEGMIGLPLFLGGESAAAEIFIQVPGDGLRMAAGAFRRHVESERTLHRSLLLYTQALLTQVGQCSVCTHSHPIGARCARWLLQTHDRVKGDEFPLTHEFIGLMLGVRRATVTVVAQDLQARGLIRYHRGVISVINRAGLERASCDCYALISREFARLTLAMKRAPVPT